MLRLWASFSCSSSNSFHFMSNGVGPFNVLVVSPSTNFSYFPTSWTNWFNASGSVYGSFPNVLGVNFSSSWLLVPLDSSSFDTNICWLLSFSVCEPLTCGTFNAAASGSEHDNPDDKSVFSVTATVLGMCKMLPVEVFCCIFEVTDFVASSSVCHTVVTGCWGTRGTWFNVKSSPANKSTFDEEIFSLPLLVKAWTELEDRELPPCWLKVVVVLSFCPRACMYVIGLWGTWFTTVLSV
jgi:hypothetical protein